jgi:hypothetical protein
MAWATEMGSLVGNIKSSHTSRTRFVNDVKKDAEAIQQAGRDLIADHQEFLKDMANELRSFLSTSESTRKADFKALMGGITSDLEVLGKRVVSVLDGYASERKIAASAWASLPERHAASEEAVSEETAPTPRKRGRRKNK